ENVLNLLRQGDLAFEPHMMDVMLQVLDQMKVLFMQVVDQKLVALDLSASLTQLVALTTGTRLAAPEPVQAAPPPAAAPAPETAEAEAPAKTSKPAEAAPAPAPAAPSQPSVRRDRSTETIRVEVERLDNLMNLVGELVLGRNRMLQLLTDVDDRDPAHQELLRDFADTASQVDFITTELQSAVMHTRMVQIGRIFNKFPRVIRDLAKEFGKQIDLTMEGQETELDKSLTEEISDPLVHLIRNACDHGVESPEERLAKGKPAQGTVRLAAAHEGNHIAIVIEDDGAGIDAERLKKKSVDRGLITQKEADDMSDSEAFQLIFRPGLSTAEKVSKVSGRGVGMDVVKTNITRLNGSISIQSEVGVGSRFTLKLPLTLAIIQSLLVQVQEETYAIPLHSVSEVVNLEAGDITSVNKREVIRLRDEIVPLLRVSTTVGLQPHGGIADGYAVILHIGHERIGLVVDSLVGQKEIVIKPLGHYLKKIQGIAGSTILGDGRVIMILDVGEIVRIEKERRAMSLPHTPVAA
ncbi:MAG: chemotaxis protein CheA, partial [Bacteroidota bacterium]